MSIPFESVDSVAFAFSNDQSDRTVLVSGLPEEATESSVHIHFQKKKNGGGEVEKVTLLAGGKALVVFDDSKVAKIVVATEQKFQGNILQVKLLERETRGHDAETTEKAGNSNQICGTVLGTDPINQLEENLQCSVCLEALKDPRTLPCCHSFCKDCLQGVVKTCRDKARRDRRPIREFPCPDCRTMFTLEPDKHVADMPRNHFICNMVQVTAELDRGTRVPCSHNCSQSFSVARCITCEKFLCQECLTDHNKYRGNDGHSVLTMEELSKPENRSKIKGKMYCNEHASKTLKVYCETCDQLICKDCMHFKHHKQNHSCLLVKDVASNYKELLASNNKAMEDALTEGNAFLRRLSLVTAGLNSEVENVKRVIVQRKEFMAKKVVEMLNQKAGTLLKEVEEIHKSEREKLDSQTTETKLYVDSIDQSVQLSKKLVEQGTEEEVISSQKMMLENANNLLTKRSQYFKDTIPVSKVSYTSLSSGSEKAVNDEVCRVVENSFGKVNKGTGINVSLNLQPRQEIRVRRELKPHTPTENNTNTKNNSKTRVRIPPLRSNKPDSNERRRNAVTLSTFLVKRTQTNHDSLSPTEMKSNSGIDTSTVAITLNKKSGHDTTPQNSTKMITTDSETTRHRGSNSLENGYNASFKVDTENDKLDDLD